MKDLLSMSLDELRNKITDDVSSPIRFHASKEVARQYLGNRKKNPWTNKKFDKVDWEHLKLAMKTNNISRSS